jgi:hypothetical protein
LYRSNRVGIWHWLWMALALFVFGCAFLHVGEGGCLVEGKPQGKPRHFWLNGGILQYHQCAQLSPTDGLMIKTANPKIKISMLLLMTFASINFVAYF